MKKLFIFLFYLGHFGLANAQQQNKYSRVKINLDNEHQLIKLAEAGLEVDHGLIEKNESITSDYSSEEIRIIQQLGFSYHIEIEDVQAYYVQQNQIVSHQQLSKAASCFIINSKQISTPFNFVQGTMGGYYTYQEMLDQLDSMASKYPNLIKARTPIDTFHSIEGNSIYWLKISDNPNIKEAESEILYTALHHAREPMSLSQEIMFMWYLLENYAADPEIQYLVDNTELYFVPCLNPDGYLYNEFTNPQGGGLWRKNRREVLTGQIWGVDINRNYGYNWGFNNIGSSPNGFSETYRGTTAFSEPETQAMKWFCEHHQFQIAMNHHSYSNLLVYPWGYQANTYTPDSLVFRAHSKLMTEENHFKTGTTNQTLNYLTNGDSNDWMYGEQATKPKILSYVPETGSSFWPPASDIEPNCLNNIIMNLNALRLVNKYYKVEPVFNTTNNFKYNISRLGLKSSASASVSIASVNNKVLSTGSTKVYANMNLLQTVLDSITFTINPSTVTDGETIKLLLSVFNGDITVSDTVLVVAHTGNSNPSILFSNNASSISPIWMNGPNNSNWGIDNTLFVSSPSSITDSPSGNYSDGNYTTLNTVAPISLVGNYSTAVLSYFARWEIQSDRDYANIQYSIDNGNTWISLCGNYTRQLNNGPGYDGVQTSWVNERIDISFLIGQSNVLFSFGMASDYVINMDGFYFDDFKITTNSSLGLNNARLENPQSAYPNPFNEKLTIDNLEAMPSICNIYNSHGVLVYTQLLKGFTTINTENWLKGLYLLQIVGKSDSKTKYLKLLKQ
jgi:carboxypeptidase T